MYREYKSMGNKGITTNLLKGANEYCLDESNITEKSNKDSKLHQDLRVWEFGFIRLEAPSGRWDNG